MYSFITQHDSPNYTPKDQCVATWGVSRKLQASEGAKIAIHWWDDPLNNPSFEGVIATLCNPARQASAHFVATGTGRRVACLVNLPDASWATNNANPFTFSIECDPRCRDEDYDVIAELIAELRAEYGDLPLVPHRQYYSTRCPGNYDLARLDALARKKQPYATGDFGKVQMPITTPVPVPTPTPAPSPFSGYRVFSKDGAQIGAYLLRNNAYAAWKDKTARLGKITDTMGVNVTLAVVSEYEKAPVVDTTVSDRIGAVEKRLSVLETVVASLASSVSAIKDFLANLFTTFKR